MESIKKILGLNLARLRKSRGFTQESLAEKIDASTQAISNIETGNSWPSFETISLICSALKIKDTALFEFETSSDQKSETTPREALGIIQRALDEREMPIPKPLLEALGKSDRLKTAFVTAVLTGDVMELKRIQNEAHPKPGKRQTASKRSGS